MPKCCSAAEGELSWQYLKELARSNDAKELGIYRTKVGCLRICRAGPIALVYPDGTWYRDMTPENCKRVFEQHLIGGTVCEDIAFAHNPLVSMPNLDITK